MFNRALIGMVHTLALPTAPGVWGVAPTLDALIARAVEEALLLRKTGFDAIIIENMHDAPYASPPHDPAVVAAMTRVVLAVREAVGESMRLGVQVLSRGEHEALAIAHASGADFVRCENFVFGHVADEGLMTSAGAPALLRYRKNLGATHVKLFVDLQKKHASHAMSADLSLRDWVEGAVFFGADGLIVTGTSTGRPTDPTNVEVARAHSTLPVLVGSGVTPPQVGPLLERAHALIVGSFIKKNGVWHESLDEERCKAIIRARG